MTSPHDVSYQRLVEIRHHRAPENSKRVLVVEDNPDTRDGLGEALEDAGYEVVTVENGLKALDHLRWSWRPGCVVLDMRMPVMTGWELRETMAGDPSLGTIPVIGMTGGRWKPEDAGRFFSVLAKPIVVKELLAGLEAVWHFAGAAQTREGDTMRRPGS